MNCLVRLGNCFLRVALMYQPSCLLPCCQGKPGELAKNCYLNLRNSSFCLLVFLSVTQILISRGVSELLYSFKHELIPFITRTVPKERCGVERGKPICSLVAVEDCANEVQPAAQQECREIPREVCQDVVREECDDDVTAAASGLDSVINAGIEGNEIDSEIVGQALQLVRVRLKPRRFYH